MAGETGIQAFIHRLEEGGWARFIKIGALVTAVIALAGWFLFSNFRGLSHAKGMEQGEIAREIAQGNGFSTKTIRPLAWWQLRKNKGEVPANIPDTYHAPLHPAVLAPFLRLAKSRWIMSDTERIYIGDRIVAGLSMLFFLLGVLLTYFTAKRIFDQRLAVLAAGLMIICHRFWQFSMTGLPQMLMLLLFGGATYALVRAIENKCEGKSPTLWLAAVGLFFGLLALAHGLTIWIFAGALAFVALTFTPRLKNAAVVFVVFAVVYAPFLVRNHMVSGNPLGVAGYTSLMFLKGSENSLMRSPEMDLTNLGLGVIRHKLQTQFTAQMANLFGSLGHSVAAAAFFLSLLHLFKRPETSSLRWGLLLMWLSAAFGMSFFGIEEVGLSANDLHILFIPLLICYGLAFILVLWTRLEITVPLLRIGFLSLLFFLSGLPLITTIFGPANAQVQWPPYVPPYIAIINKWIKPHEVVASDMPWAVAWYADRKSLWIPNQMKEFIRLHDYPEMGGPIVGLYLTPVSGYQPFLNEVVKGTYKDWAPFIMRNADTRRFPLQAATPMPIDAECFFYSDYKRWEENKP